MSGFFGIFNRNGKPIEEKTVHTMLDAMSYWEPDERNTWIDGPVALGHAMLWNTPESKYEHLPLEKDAYVLTMDARIDNREELITELELPDRSLEEIGDSEFILAAYKKWGEECPKHLLGDFAFAIWDGKKQQLFCARDHVGIKSLYYHANDEIFVFSNDIHSLIVHENVPKKFNDLAVLNFLHDIEDQTQTFFSEIVPLSPATTLTIKDNSIDKIIYWRAEDSPEIKFDTIDEYIQSLRKLLEDAVQVRIRSVFPLTSHLSGGLDSSSISVLASRGLKEKNKKLYTFNWVHSPNKDDLAHFEWSFSRQISEQERIDHRYVDLTPKRLVSFYREQNIVFNDKQYLWYEQIVRKEAKKLGVRTILSGWGGDELITYNGSTLYTEMFWQRNSFHAIKLMYQESRLARNPLRHFLGKCYKNLLLPFLPERFYRHSLGMKQYEWDVLKCAQPEFFKQSKKIPMIGSKISRANMKHHQLSLFYQGHIQNRIDSWESSSFSDQIEYRYPLLDKRVVEFALGIPYELYKQDNYGRYLFRKTIEPILPKNVCWGNIKLEPNRIALLYDLMFEAQNLWRETCSLQDFTTNPYVNVEKIINYIDETYDKWALLNQDEKLERLIIIYKSIMILQITNINYDISSILKKVESL